MRAAQTLQARSTSRRGADNQAGHEALQMAKLKHTFQIESTFAQYVATELLGEGGAGKVYRAETDVGEPVAIKVLAPEKSKSRSPVKYKLRRAPG